MDMQFADEAPPGCQELLKMDVRQMNAQRGHQWVNAMAQCIQTTYQSSKFIGSSESNLELSDQAGGIYGTGSPMLVGMPVQMLETTIQMQQLLQFIWKHRSIF